MGAFQIQYDTTMRIPVLAKPGAAHPDREARHGEPLTFGVPLPRGLVKDVAGWIVGVARRGAQARPDARARPLVGRQRPLGARRCAGRHRGRPLRRMLDSRPRRRLTRRQTPAAIAISESGGTISVDTSRARFRVRQGGAFPFEASRSMAPPRWMPPEAASRYGRHGVAHRATVGARGGRGARTVAFGRSCARQGSLDGGRIAPPRLLACISSRVSAVVRLLITLTNPNRAVHKGGFWDLGDPGSILLRDVSMAFGLPSAARNRRRARLDRFRRRQWSAFATPFELYQDSSGGENWQSSQPPQSRTAGARRRFAATG